MAGTEVGTAYVAIIPSARGFAKQLQKDIAREFKGSKLDDLIGKALAGTHVTVPVRTDVDTSDIPDQVRGREPELPVRLDPLTRTLQSDVRRELAALSREVSADIPVTAETDQLRTEISAAIADVEQRLSADIPTEPADRREYERELRAMVDDVSRRVRSHVSVDVDVDEPALRRSVEKVKVDVESRRLGDRMGDRASEGLIARLGQSISSVLPASPWVLIGGAALGAGLASAAAAALTGGLLGAAGLGVLGIGAMLVKDQPEVAVAAKQLIATVTSVFKSAALPLVEPITNALEMIRHATVAWSDQFREIFRLIAPVVEPLTEGLIGLVSNALPGLTEFIRASAPFLISLAGELPKLGEYLNMVFRIIDGGGPGATQFFHDLFAIVGIAIVGVAGLIRVFTELYPVFRTLVLLTPIGTILGLGTAAIDARDKIAAFGQGVKATFDRVVAWISAAWRSVRGDTDGFLGFIAALPSRILRSLGGLGNLLHGSGRALIQGLINGIQSMLGPLGGVLGSVTSFIQQHKGPPERDAVLLEPAGQAIMGGLIRGIHGERAALAAELAGVTSDISVGAPSFAAGYRAPAAPAPAQAWLDWRPGATGDPILDGLRGAIAVTYGGDPDAALRSS